MDKIKLITLITVLAMASSGLVSCGQGNGKDTSKAEKDTASSAAEKNDDSRQTRRAVISRRDENRLESG